MNDINQSDMKQVQFRMPSELHRELRKALIDNDSSMAAFFNQAAVEYLEKINGKADGCDRGGSDER